MGRIPTFRANYNELPKLSLANLKRHDYMTGWRSGTMTWMVNGLSKVGVTVNLDCVGRGNYVELKYRVDGHLMNYRVELVQVPSNLGKGYVWYFVCPLTDKRCRTLYLADKYFVSREALPGMLYESQTHSKRYREFSRTFGLEFKLDELYSNLYKRYAKKHYRGKPTPKMRKVMKLEGGLQIFLEQRQYESKSCHLP